MPFRNLDAKFYVEQPIEFTFEDGHVLVTVGSGRWCATFIMSEINFLASNAKACLLANELRCNTKRGQLLSLPSRNRSGGEND